jgi:hypothetical protein
MPKILRSDYWSYVDSGSADQELQVARSVLAGRSVLKSCTGLWLIVDGSWCRSE